MTHRLEAASLLLVLSLVAGGCGTKSRPDPAKHGGVIIYASSFGSKPKDNFDLFAAYADGSNTWRLTDTAKECESTPVLTVDRKSFFFYRFRCPLSVQEAPVLWRMNVDGSGESEVLKLNGGDWPESAYPSPDGKSIAIAARGLWIVHADASGSFEKAKRISVAVPVQVGYDLWPIDMEWSGDGKFFVIPLVAERGTALFSVNAQSLEVKQLTHPKEDDQVDLSSVISGDSRYIAFVREKDTGSGELHYGGSLGLVDLGSGEERLLPGGDASPIAFTPDGKELLYGPESLDSNGYATYSLGDGKRRLFLCSRASPATVSPDGKRTLAESVAGESATLVTSDLSGANKHTIGKLKRDDLYLGMIGPVTAWSEPGFSEFPPRFDFGRCRESSLGN